MNSLSLLLYAASVSEKLSVGLLVSSGIALAWAGVLKAFADADGKPQPRTRHLVFSAMVAVTIAAFLPSKQTVYMIAASETAERVAATPEAREMMDLLRRKIIATLSDPA